MTLSDESSAYAVTVTIKKTSDALSLLEHRLQDGQVPGKIKQQPWYADSWMLVTLLVSYITDLASSWYFFQTHQLVLYGDSYAHMLITRRLFDNATPGFAQLGGVWLPLPHLLMLPFIWNDYLWRTGLAGSFSSMACYLVAVFFLF